MREQNEATLIPLRALTVLARFSSVLNFWQALHPV